MLKSEKAKPGDYVTGRIHGGDETDIRQAVFVRNNGDGTVYAKGHFGVSTRFGQDALNCDDHGGYIFDGPDDLDVVPDRNLHGDTIGLVAEVRASLGLEEKN